MDVLGQFREDPLPPSGVDVARAVSTGRRRRRFRIGGLAAGVVAVATAGVLTAPQLLRPASHAAGGETRPQPASAPLTCKSPGPLPDLTQAAEQSGAPAEFDALRHWVDVENVTGLEVKTYATARMWQRLELVDATEATTVEITVYAKDAKPVFAGAPGVAPTPIDPTTGTRSDPVGGAPAYWLPGRQVLYQFEVARLGWQWSSGAWAFVAAADTSTFDPAIVDAPKTTAQLDQLRAVARRVAAALRIGPGTPVTSPFAMSAPDCTRLVGTDLLSSTARDGASFTRFTLTFAPDGYTDPNPLVSRRDVPTVQVTADSHETAADKPGSATSDIDGHAAYVSTGSMVVHGVDGFALELSAPGGVPVLLALFHSVHIVPGAKQSQAAWTDAPVVR